MATHSSIPYLGNPMNREAWQGTDSPWDHKRVLKQLSRHAQVSTWSASVQR